MNAIESGMVRGGVPDLGSLSRLALLRWRDAFRQNPPGSVAKERRGLIEADFALCISLVHALELLQQHGVRTFFNFLHGKTDPDGDGGRIRTELQVPASFSFSSFIDFFRKIRTLLDSFLHFPSSSGALLLGFTVFYSDLNWVSFDEFI